jgi:predicted Zn-dependent protease
VGVVAMFERLENAYRLTDSGAYPYLRSHPLTVERIGEARARVDGAPGGRPGVRTSLAHALMQARARVLQETDVQSLRRAQAQDQAAGAGTERLAALYASALASLQLREPARAQVALDAAAPLLRAAAADESRARLAFTLAQAQAWQAGGQAARALALLETVDARDSRPVLLARAQAALDAARVGGSLVSVRASTESLQTWVAEHKIDATAWGLLGQCADVLGLKLRSLRAQAEAQAAIGDIGGAMDRLRAAQRLARSGGGTPDFIESSIIDSRLRDLTAQRRAQLAALRGENRRGGEPGEERSP